MAINQTGAVSSSQRTCQSGTTGWQATRWSNASSMGRGKPLAFQTRMPSPTYMTLHATQEPQQTRQLPTSPPSIAILPALTSSSQLPLKLLGHGTRWLLGWFGKLAGGSHLALRTPGRQYFCSSACPLPFNGGNAVSFHGTFTTE